MAGLKVPTILNVCGSALPITEKMLECSTSAVAYDERTAIVKAKEVVKTTGSRCVVIGNVPAHAVIYKGPVEAIRNTVKRAIEEGTDMVAPGCDFWIETPTEHIKAFVDSVIELGSPSQRIKEKQEK